MWRSGGGGAHGDELVALCLGGCAYAAVAAGFDADDLAASADIHLPGWGKFLRQGEHKIDLAADFKFGFGKKIQAAVADVASIGVEVVFLRFAWKDAHGQAHQA